MWNEWTIGLAIGFGLFVVFFGGWKILKPRRAKSAAREE